MATTVERTRQAGERTRQAILDYIQRYERKYHEPPVIESICLGIGRRSKSGVYYQLQRLVEDGRLRYLGRRSEQAYTTRLLSPIPPYDEWPLASAVVSCRAEPGRLVFDYYEDAAA